MIWRTSRRELDLQRPLVMGIINATPDSFSDGGIAFDPDDALRRAECLVAEGAAILDIGGESTRPGSSPISDKEETRRVVPIVEAVAGKLDTPISVDTTKSAVAKRAIEAGAEIINDISALRFDEQIADLATATGAGLVLMHSRGRFEAMHGLEPVNDVIADVTSGLNAAVNVARDHGVRDDQMVLDPGIGFGKSAGQNLELIAKLGKLKQTFPGFPLLVGASRKSFIGQVIGDAAASDRLYGSLAVAAVSAWNGASIIRVHDVKATVDALRIVEALKACI